MKSKWTRRKFLKGCLKSAVVGGSGAMGGLATATGRALERNESLPCQLTSKEWAILRAAMDEIIPAGEGMPAASAAGSVEYLARQLVQSPQLVREFKQGLATLDRSSRATNPQGFLALSQAQRVEQLRTLESRGAPAFFVTLRDYTYEAYYTRPEIWKLVGYECYPTNQSGPPMKEFDAAVLKEVRKKTKLFREDV